MWPAPLAHLTQQRVAVQQHAWSCWKKKRHAGPGAYSYTVRAAWSTSTVPAYTARHGRCAAAAAAAASQISLSSLAVCCCARMIRSSCTPVPVLSSPAPARRPAIAGACCSMPQLHSLAASQPAPSIYHTEMDGAYFFFFAVSLICAWLHGGDVRQLRRIRRFESS